RLEIEAHGLGPCRGPQVIARPLEIALRIEGRCRRAARHAHVASVLGGANGARGPRRRRAHCSIGTATRKIPNGESLISSSGSGWRYCSPTYRTKLTAVRIKA